MKDITHVTFATEIPHHPDDGAVVVAYERDGFWYVQLDVHRGAMTPSKTPTLLPPDAYTCSHEGCKRNCVSGFGACWEHAEIPDGSERPEKWNYTLSTADNLTVSNPATEWEPKVGDWVRDKESDAVYHVDRIAPRPSDGKLSIMDDRERIMFPIEDFEPWRLRVGEIVMYCNHHRVEVLATSCATGGCFLGRYVDEPLKSKYGEGHFFRSRSRPIPEGKPTMTSAQELAEVAAKASHASIALKPLVDAFSSTVKAIAQAARTAICPDCKGSGEYVGLDKRVPCPTCKGAG